MSVLSRSGHIVLSASNSIVIMHSKSGRVDLNIARGNMKLHTQNE